MHQKIIQCFSIDIPANKAALLLGKNRNKINHWYGVFRQAIYHHQTALKDKLLGRVELMRAISFELYLKESEWRWKKQPEELPRNYGNSSDIINLSDSLEPIF